MSWSSLRRTHTFERLSTLLPGIAWVGALALAAWVCATVFWRIQAPTPVGAVTQNDFTPQEAAQRIAGGMSATPAAQTSPSTTQRYELVGVATGFAGNLPGFALLQGPGGETFAATLNERLPDGTRLVALHAESVELDRAGVRETIALTTQRQPVAAAPVSAPSVGGNAPTPQARPAPPGGRRNE